MRNKFLRLALATLFIATALLVGVPSKSAFADECVGDSSGGLYGFCVALTNAYIDVNNGLTFTWAEGQGFDYFNMIWSRPGKDPTQVEIDGSTFFYEIDNAGSHVGTTYELQVEGCNNGTFSSDCTAWDTLYFEVPAPAPQILGVQEFWNQSQLHHFTTGSLQSQKDAQNAGFRYIRTVGDIFASQQPGTIPLEEFWSQQRLDHYTTDSPRGQQDALSAGYILVRTGGYVFAT